MKEGKKPEIKNEEMVSGKKHMNVLNLNRISEIKTVT
jgi:hypothetical protein